MTKVNRDDFDRLFDKAFEDATKQQISPPDPDPSWAAVSEKLRKRRKKRNMKPFLYIAVASFFVITFAFLSPGATKAFDPFIQSIKDLQSGVVSFIFGNHVDDEGHGLTTPPPDMAEPTEGQIIEKGVLDQTSYATWEEAAGHIEFDPPSIGYLPEGDHLSEVILFTERNKKAEKAVLLYSNSDEGRSWMLTFRLLQRNETLTTGSDSSAGEYKQVEVSGQTGYLFITKDGRASLDYMMGNIVVTIAGTLTEEQILKVAENIG